MISGNDTARSAPRDVASHRSLFFSAGFNLAGELAVAALGVICIPYMVRRLGTEAFGILSLSWIVLTYVTLFDLGLSRATTKFAAEATGKGHHHQLPDLLTVSLTLQLLLGTAGGLALFVAAPWIARHAFHIAPALLPAAINSFRTLSVAVPIILLSNAARALLEALQRFDLINLVRVPANASTFLSAVVVLLLGGGLVAILVLTTFFRLVALFAYLRLCRSQLPKSTRGRIESVILRRMLNYGGWVTVSNVTGPVLVYLDRFMIGILMSVNAVAFYSAPADIMNRALVVPASLSAVLFPAFSFLNEAGDRQQVQDLYGRAMKYLVVGLGPVLLLVIAFAHDIIRLWLGPEFAAQSTVPLQILAFAIFINSLAYFPYSLLQGLGMPNVTATFHLLELPVHFVLVWYLVSRMGIVGAAVATAIRILIDTSLLSWWCSRLQLTSVSMLRRQGLLSGCALLGLLAAAIWFSNNAGLGLGLRVAVAIFASLLYVAAQLHWSFDVHDRDVLFRRRLGSPVPETVIAAADLS